jgi:hypothetical protein
VLESAGWSVQTHLRVRNPSREIDVYATKDDQELILQLKSTLRPHSPWEVFKRNKDVIAGIDHTAEVLPLFRHNARGFVVTDGYSGDYATWAQSLDTSIAVGTLEDLELIAANPVGAFQALKQRVGIAGAPVGAQVLTREAEICDWRIRLVDAPRPL